MNEKGSLPIGVTFEGALHKEFEVRPRIVRDSVDAMELDRARKNEAYLGAAILAAQIVRLGQIPKEKISAELLLDMYDEDFSAIDETSRRLGKLLTSFRKDGPARPEAGAGAS